MTPHERALELVRLAGRDERAARVLQADPTIEAATVGFHYQQAAEKLLKALLAERNIDYPRTHNLAVLVELVGDLGLRVPVADGDLAGLTLFAVTARYEEDDETRHFDPMHISTMIDRLREWVEGELGSSDAPEPSPDRW